MPSTIKPMSNLNIFLVKVFLTTVMTFQVNRGQFPWHEQGKKEYCPVSDLTPECVVQDGQGGQCQALHQPTASGASRGGSDPCDPGGRVSSVQGPGQDGQVSRGPQAAQRGAGNMVTLEGWVWWWWWQVQEIMELKKALAKTRQDLQKTRSRRQSQDNRSSSDEVSTPSLSCLSLTDGISHSLVSVCVICSKFFLCHSNHVWTMPGTWRCLAPVYWVWVSSSYWKPSAHWFPCPAPPPVTAACVSIVCTRIMRLPGIQGVQIDFNPNTFRIRTEEMT